MRESIGGAWLMGIVITFIFLFAGFLAYSISYTKAFNVKNEVVNIIEQNMGVSGFSNNHDVLTPDNQLDNSAHDKIIRLVKNTGYNYETANTIDCVSGEGNGARGHKMGGLGVCVIKYCPTGSATATGADRVLRRKTNVHYKVTTYISFNIPVVNITLKIPITGETSTIYTDNSGFECGDEKNITWRD